MRLDSAGGSKIGVIKVIASYTSLVIGKELVDGAPSIVREEVSFEEAEALRDRLVAAGARATIMRGDIELAPVEGKVADEVAIGGGPWTSGTPLEVARVSDGEVLASGAVGASTFELMVPTRGVAVDVLLRARFAAPMSTNLFHFNHPLSVPRNLGAQPFVPNELFGSYARLSETAMDPECGMLQVVAQDAAGTELAGVRFTSPPGTQLLYVDERGGYTPGRAETSEYGTAFLLNLPPGQVQVGAHAAGAPWPVATVRIEAGIGSALFMRREPF